MRLAELQSFRTQLLNMIVHDMATPLTVLRLQLDLLAQRDLALADPESQRRIDVLRRNIVHLTSMTADLRDVAQMEAGRLRLHLHDVDLGQLCDDMRTTLQPLAEGHGATLTCEHAGTTLVRGDSQRLSQVLTNLVTNAVKFAPGGRVTIALAATEGVARVEVRDTGAGIAPAALEELFKPFSQVHEDLRAKNGTGLGLFIVKGIIEAHQGRVGCESKGRGHGATFWFEMPRIPAPTEPRLGDPERSERLAPSGESLPA